MTTEIQRIPGAFNLPEGWPRVEIIDLDAGLFAHYVATEADYNTATGWTDRAGNADLTSLSSSAPQLMSNPTGVSFVEADKQWAESLTIPQTYDGPLTVSGVFRWVTSASEDEASMVFSTSTGGAPYYALRINETTGNVIASTAFDQNIFLPMTEGVYAAVVAVFNGAESSITVNGITESGSLTGGSMPLVRLGNNSSKNQPLHGRIAEMRIHTRALSTSEIAAVTSELSTSWGL